ncbi:Protein of unknown function [Pyronema omphalodes CBS 100304]|uniref:Uncharacterized protein n=1 Tax=Pyronema omphalodes (strain CBS 100304) TaxID=1076935 RepID=U4LQM3_PYROM|nr:Protein of unknown function [Pyronema omphalodes CBS 100304]
MSDGRFRPTRTSIRTGRYQACLDGCVH